MNRSRAITLRITVGSVSGSLFLDRDHTTTISDIYDRVANQIPVTREMILSISGVIRKQHPNSNYEQALKWASFIPGVSPHRKILQKVVFNSR